MEHGIDTAPTAAEVTLFHTLLLAEAEQMGMNMGCEEPEGPAGPGEERNQCEGSSRVTRQEGTLQVLGTGRRLQIGRKLQVRSSTHIHDWHNVNDKQERCWICSAKGHRKRECPAMSKETQLPPAIGGSIAGKEKQGKGKGKTKKGNTKKE